MLNKVMGDFKKFEILNHRFEKQTEKLFYKPNG